MKNNIVGRAEEQRILQEALTSNEAEMVAVIGRRRIGKTFLINEVYGDSINFEVTGIQNAPKSDQIRNFIHQLNTRINSPINIFAPSDWLNTFFLLVSYLKTLDNKKRKVVLFDELSWFYTPNSGFLRALGWFWNSWAVNENIVVVICGSAASWMRKKVINHRGGLHNRITKRVFLYPFTLKETEEYLQSKNVQFTYSQIIEIYMAFGGIPYYLNGIEARKSVAENMDKICFASDGSLKDEFSKLYPALFENSERHEAIVRALAKSAKGLTRGRLIEKSKVPNGGNVSQVLKELEQSGFITSYYPFGKKKKGKLFRLTDEYSLFYLRFIEGKKKEGSNNWQHLNQQQGYKIWSGYAFENICLKHIPVIKNALGIRGVYSETSTFYKQGTDQEKGTQIDLLLDRNDRVINLFEIKFYDSEFVVTEAYAKTLREKRRIFRESTGTRKYLMLSLITTFGLKHNMHSLGLIEQVLKLDDFFQ